MHLIKYILIYFLIYFSNISPNPNDFDPYKTLGISRTASDKEIRQSYKKLAKYWHPDKNSQPNAHDQFTKINAAYEILSDPTKRQNYDQYGTTTPQDNDHHGHHFRDPFEMFRAHFFQDAPSGAKKIIRLNEFLNDILPNSHIKPYLIFATTHFCLHCRKPLGIFRSMEQQLNDVGIGTGELNANDEYLSSELGISNLPSLCAISQGRVYHYDYPDFSETNIKEFLRNSIPIKRYIKTLNTYDEIIKFLSSSNQTNRVNALLLTKQKHPTFKFLLPCLQYSKRIQCAVFNSSLTVIKNSNSLPRFLKEFASTSDTILLFKEDYNHPDVIIKDNEFNLNFIEKTFESNQILYLPRITSSDVFNLACQINSHKPCYLLIGDRNLYSHYHYLFVDLSKQLFKESKCHMAYLDISSQGQYTFNNILSSYYQNNEKKLFVLMVRRWAQDKIEIQSTDIEFDEESLNQIPISENVKILLNIPWQNPKQYSLPVIIDFDQESIFMKIIDKVRNQWNYHIERSRFLRYLLGYVYTYQFWLITIGLFALIYFSKDDHKKKYVNNKKTNKTNNQRKIYVFNEALLRYYTDPSASNVILLVLIADTSQDACVKNFKQEINSIRQNSRMIFSIFYRENSSKWLNELINNIEDNQIKQSIELSSSTILALYIRRKFFVSYSLLTSTLTCSDWMDLLFNGNFREPINITEWPYEF